MTKYKGKHKRMRYIALALGALMSVSLLGNAACGSPDPEKPKKDSSLATYKTEFDSLQEVFDAQTALNDEIGGEGLVLLKNKANNLPFSSVKKISLFGKNSVNPVYSGTGSSGGTSGAAVGFVESLQSAGFTLNPKLLEFYKNNDASGVGRDSVFIPPAEEGGKPTIIPSYSPTGETPQSMYTQDVKDSYNEYNDAAVVVFSRVGGEGNDLSRTAATALPTRDEAEGGTYNPTPVTGRTDVEDHILMLDDNEEALLNDVAAKFGKVVVVINSSNIMELDRTLLVNNDKVQSIIWAAGGGQNGFSALGKILKGEINPSGRTTDTWSVNFKNDPTWANYADNNVQQGSNFANENGEVINQQSVFYKEGIYVGYKYYETRGFTDGDDWYNAAVNYPFGYGLSYTAFKWEVGDVKLSTSALTAKTEISVDVKVTNTGSRAGKDVVELYYSAPYTAGKTEKSHVVLGAFEKTDLLEPGKSQTVKLSLNGFDMASFDVYDKDGDGHKGYELDKGDYNLYIGKDSHDAWKNGTKKTVNLASDVNIDKDPTTNADIALRFGYINEEMKDKLLSRNDWEGTWPTTPDWYQNQELVKTEEWLKGFELPSSEKEDWVMRPSYDEGKPWYSATAPAFRDEAQAYTAENKAPIQLKDMVGVDYDNAKWKKFIEQLTVNQAYDLIKTNIFQFNENAALGIPVAGHSDGPVGITGGWVGGGKQFVKSSGNVGMATETLVAATWNKGLAKREGELVGEHGLWTKVVGWYAPGANIHRSPFSGRNFEYYSEDATLSGIMLENVVKGATSKGLVPFMKHYALNDQETNRYNGSTWADEQTIREAYVKPFEWAIKSVDGKGIGLMAAFNRIGYTWCGASYEFLTELTRGEFGFRGSIITDAHMSGSGYMYAAQMIRAGTDMSLDSHEGTLARIVNSEAANTPTQLTAVYNSVKNILYTMVNSAAIDHINYMGLTPDAAPAANNGVEVAVGAAIAETKLNGTEGLDYILLTGRLPKGLTLNKNGTITGTVAADAAPGEYTVVYTQLVKGAGKGEQYLTTVMGGYAGPFANTSGKITITVK